VLGYFCLGVDARVPGWAYDENALDLGLGLRPDLTGRGQGTAFLRAVLSHIAEQQPGAVLRATIASWNQRAIRMCRNAGFHAAGTFATTRDDRTKFTVMLWSSVA
jgi:RimJ/RimL family protein N-acetyltransferase